MVGCWVAATNRNSEDFLPRGWQCSGAGGLLEATLAGYGTGRALEEIPVLRMISMRPGEIRARSRRHTAIPQSRGAKVS